jgi:hypothetical protein
MDSVCALLFDGFERGREFSAGIDMALAIIGWGYGEETAEAITVAME